MRNLPLLPMIFKRKFFLLFLALIFSTYSFSQTYNIDDVDGQTISTCSGTFYDPGGPGVTGLYDTDATHSVTFSANNGGQIQIDFFGFDLEDPDFFGCFDTLSIYDGTSAGAPLIGTYCGTNSPGLVTSTTGSLHFVFFSDNIVVDFGWQATISCTAPPVDVCTVGATSGTVTVHDDDADGVNEACDLDKDNDGILDSNEGNCVASYNVDISALGIVSGGLSQTFNNISGSGVNLDLNTSFNNVGSNVIGISGDILLFGMDGTDINDASQNSVLNFVFSESIRLTNFIIADIDRAGFQDEVEVQAFDENNNAVQLSFALGSALAYNSDGYVVDPTGTFGASGTDASNQLTITSSAHVRRLVITNRLGDGQGFTNPNFQAIEILDFSFCTVRDSDGDGTPDYLDTDSDNDGCPDAVEAAGSFYPSDLTGDRLTGTDSNDDGLIDTLAPSGQANTSEVTNNAISTACTVDLKLTKTVGAALPKVGDNVVYLLSVVNRGRSKATGVNVVDVIPPTVLTYVSDNPSQGSYSTTTDIWTIGDIGINETKTLEITVRVEQSGIIINTAQISQINETDVDSTPNNGG